MVPPMYLFSMPKSLMFINGQGQTQLQEGHPVHSSYPRTQRSPSSPTCPVYITKPYPTGIDTHAKAGYQAFSFRRLKLGTGTKPGSHQDWVASLTALYRGPGILLWYLWCDNHFATHEKTRLREKKKRMLEDGICTFAEACRPTAGPSLPKTTNLSIF